MEHDSAHPTTIKKLRHGLGPHLVVSTFSQLLVCPFTSALTFSVCFPSLSGHHPNIILQPPDSVQHHSQSPIIAKSLSHSIVSPPSEPNSNISTGTCKGNCPCGKTSKPPIVVLLLPLPREITALPVGHIYVGVQIFPRLDCVASLELITVEKCLSTQER